MVKFKRIISILTAMIICMVLLVPSMPIAAASYLETDTSTAASGCTMLGIDGSYYVEAQNALDRINEIRKEACEAGNVPDPRNSSRYLTSSDYVEIKWSVSLEKIARIRAAEASMTMAHKRLNDEGIFNITYGDMTSSGECLAWYFGNGLIKGINLWYGEMDDWINQTEGAVTGHYTSLINPNNTYVGLGDFYSDETKYANTLAGEFSSKCGSLGETPLDANMNIVQKIEVKDSYISNYFLDGSAEIAEGTTETYIPKAKVVYNGYSTNMLVLDTVTYQSSDTSVATVSSDGTVAGVSKGTATITAYSDGNVLTTLEIEVGCRHEFTYKRSGYTYTKTCSLCGATDEFTYYVYWGEDPSGTFGGSVNLRRKVGDNLYVWPSYNNDSSGSATKVVNVYSSDENVVSVSNYGYGNIKELTLSDSGIVELSIVPKDDAELTKTVIFRVGEDGALDISSAIVTLSEDLYTYTGSAHTPTPTVVYKGITLTAGTDYTVSYENNLDEGTAGVVITGTGLFSGIKKTTFVIEKMSIADAEINLENHTYVYDGAEKTPKVTVKYGNTILKENTDYTVVYSGNTDAGVATAAINGMGLYGGSKELKFTINKGFISDCMVSLSNDSFVFDGKEKKPNVTVMKAGNIVASSEYEISYKDNVDVGTATVTVTGIGNYEGEAFAAFEITPAELTDADIDITDNAYIYDGTAKEPEISVSMGGAVLQENQDYTVSYSNNLNAGTAKVIISGMGNYMGASTETFEIAPCDISIFDITLEEDSYTYNHIEYTPDIIFNNTTDRIINDTDYIIAYEDNKTAGTAKVIIHGAGNYTGTINKTFVINEKLLSDDFEVIMDASDYAYDGTEKRPSITVYDGETELVHGEDYTVSYRDNIEVGTGVIEISGMGNYGGSLEKVFNIRKPLMSDCRLVLSEERYIYSGMEIVPSITVMLGNDIIASSEYEISYKDNVDVGTATVTVTGIGNYEGEAFAAFEITPAELTDADIDITDNAYIYDGTAKEPEISVSMGGAALQENQDYTVSYSNNLNAGTAKVIISGTGNYTGEISESFAINEKPLSDDFEIIVKTSDYIYDGTEKKPSVTVYDGEIELILSEDYTVSYRDNIEAGTGVIRINGKGNYSGYLERTFNIKKPIKTEEPAPVNNEVTLPKKNSTLRSAAVNGKFKVTKTGRIVNGKVIGAEITYVRPLNKKSKVTIPASVTKDGVTYKVTAIAANAFKNNSKITKVTIGSNVRTIGTNAFYGCKKLKSVKLGKNVTTIGKGAFAKCTALTKISLPSKVKTIGVRAFYGCKRLKTITIKSTKLKTVGKYALKGINSRASIKLPKKYYKRYKKLFKSATGYKKTMRLKKV